MNNGNPTLIILTPGFPESEADVNCLPMQQSFVKSLKRIHPQLNIIVLSFQYPYHVKKYQWNDVTIMSFNGQNKGGLKRFLLRKKLNTVLADTCRNNNVIGLLSFWYGECALVANRFANKNNLPHYCWILGQDAKANNKYPKQTNASATELIALSEFLQDEFEKNHGIRPAHLIPPGLDITEFSAASHFRNIDIIGAGSLIPLKQYDVFIRVVITLSKKYPHIKAVICGKGPERKKLFDQVTAADLHRNIVFLDETDHREVLSLMQHSKILLHTSSYEGFANVYAEALYAGAHVVGFCSPMKKLFQHQHIVKDETEMVNITDKILSDQNTDHTPVLTYPVEETGKKILSLFNL